MRNYPLSEKGVKLRNDILRLSKEPTSANMLSEELFESSGHISKVIEKLIKTGHMIEVNKIRASRPRLFIAAKDAFVSANKKVLVAENSEINRIKIVGNRMICRLANNDHWAKSKLSRDKTYVSGSSLNEF